jgi:hypothetical protein
LELTSNNAVFFLDRKEEWKDVISSENLKKLEIILPDAFYVFNKQPYILFFDLTKYDLSNEKDQENVKNIHKQVWSFDQATLVVFIKENTEEYYNAIEFNRRTGTLTEIIDKDNAKKHCSFWNLQSGKTFDWFYDKYKNTIVRKRVNQQLFENIKQTIYLLSNEFQLNEKDSKILILRLIFIRYLIDRNIKIDSSFISGNENNVYERRKSFSELVAQPEKLDAFFLYLKKRFNGVLFKDNNYVLSQKQSNLLSKLFNPDGVSKEDIKSIFSDTDFDVEFQYEVFDFGIIPVELISGIYESILDEDTKNATSAIYTPPFLVDYILDQTIENYFKENENLSECKVFDPAMGSGIFLVQALRRMIDREIKLNPNLDNKSFGDRIKQIAENNLFGIDINDEAIDVACFSIYVALLDYQSPGDIDEYQFPNLKDKNFFNAHFFDLTKNDIWEKIENENLDFILGNPPWRNNNSVEHIDWLKRTKFDKIVSDKQIAQSYLIRVKDFTQLETKVALIVTSKVLYNNKAKKFKKYFLENNSLSECFDLSPVRHIIFENAINPAAILFFKVNLNQGITNSNTIVKHISIKQNRFFNKFSKNVVIEKFDQKRIKQMYFLENDWMFKVALYGNTLDFVFLKKMNNDKLSYFLKKYDVFNGNGIKKGTPRSFFSFLKDLQVIETSQIQKYYTTVNNKLPRLTEEETFLEAGRTKELFVGKKIMLGKRTKSETDLSISLIEDDCVFRDSTNAICFNEAKSELMACVYATLISSFYTYYQFITTSNWGIYYPEVHKEEYLSFPFKEPDDNQKKQLISLVNALLSPYKDFYLNFPDMEYSGEPNPKVLQGINLIINEIYEISGYENDLIDYVLNVSRYQFQDSKQKQQLVSEFNENDYRNKKKVIEQYADVYIKEFKKIYKNDSILVEVYELNNFITMHFIFLDNKSVDNQVMFVNEVNCTKKLFEKLSTLSISKIANTTDSEFNLFIQKDIKGFESNSFYIIKPSEYKCWHRAMAWYDVAEFKEAIQSAELDFLKESFRK